MPGVVIPGSTPASFVHTPGPPAWEAAGTANRDRAATTPTVPLRNRRPHTSPPPDRSSPEDERRKYIWGWLLLCDCGPPRGGSLAARVHPAEVGSFLRSHRCVVGETAAYSRREQSVNVRSPPLAPKRKSGACSPRLAGTERRTPQPAAPPASDALSARCRALLVIGLILVAGLKQEAYCCCSIRVVHREWRRRSSRSSRSARPSGW